MIPFIKNSPKTSLANWSGLGQTATNITQSYQNQLNADKQNEFNLLATLAGATQPDTIDRVLQLIKDKFGKDYSSYFKTV